MASDDVRIRPAGGEQAPETAASADAALGRASPVFHTDGGAIDLPLSLIDADDRLRPVNPAAVGDLAVSIREGGLAHPITVRPVSGRFQLVIGAHRLAAFAQLGRRTIPAQVRPLTDLEARQLEIDENLVRANLCALDRLTFMAERIEVWAARNPDKVVMDAAQPIKQRGRPPRNYIKLKQIDGFVPATMGFANETAKETGLSPISVYRAASVLAGVPSPLRQQLQGTWVANNDAALRQLATIGDREEQAAVVAVLVEGKTKNIAEARAIAAGTPIAPKAAQADTAQRDFEKAWKGASAPQRKAMLAWLRNQRLPEGWSIVGGDE